VYRGVGAQLAITTSFDLEYERAYHELSRDVFRFALSWTNDWASAEDLTQEAFLRLWSHRQSIDWSRPMLPWLAVTTRRLANNRFRALRRRFLGQPEETGVDEQFRAKWLDVRSALGTLTSLERSALLLTAVEGWTYAEAAAALQTTDGALRSAVSRARGKLEAA
jgi:RNA polymerase sigma factor (sigma-70 family)